ncbi:choline-sulfatase [Planctomicrobium piriforme]|uniref:Choline-sulfatase n=2 Tax=Planctomicrobium piriforme TaxID=1576369 RepID=A0A1I3BFZ1_9PLAN|nr:choline-sulfatase [Planctomicrobium piriforme]
MMRLWTTLWMCAACLTAVLMPVGTLQAESRPSILLLLADDLSYDAVHALGNQEVRTSNIDSLFAQGTTFTHCYNMGGWNGAICVASRTMLNTGRALWKAPQTKPQLEAEFAGKRFWSQSLKAAGYRTLMTGKWHLQIDPAKVFDEVRHVRQGMPHDSDQYNRPLDGQPDKWSPSDPKFGGYWTGGKHWSEVTADDAIAFLDESVGKTAPFFLYTAFNAPHDPRQSPTEFVAEYPADRVRVPDNFLPDDPHREAMGLIDLRDENLAPHPRTPHAVQVHRSEYYAIITHLDAQIGRILETLDRTGLRQNTVIIFTADHGLAVGQHGLMGKQNQFDHSVRVPFLICGPGITAGRKIDSPIYLQDAMPTTLQLAGAAIPPDVDFQSLLPLLHGEKPTTRQAISGGYIDFQRMATAEGYKLILYPKTKTARLYHLTDDPLEQHDLLESAAVNEENRAMSRRLFRTLLDLQRENGDNLNLTSVYPELAPE